MKFLVVNYFTDYSNWKGFPLLMPFNSALFSYSCLKTNTCMWLYIQSAMVLSVMSNQFTVTDFGAAVGKSIHCILCSQLFL